jgi:hypothetical protein
MPQEQKRRLKGRAETPGAPGSLPFKPAASPTDPYSPVTSPKTNDLLRALGAVKDLAGTAGQVGELWAGKQKEKGAVARAAGEQDTSGKSNAFIFGYESMDGKFKGIKFKQELASWAEQNKNLPQDEFESGMAELQKQRLGELYHDGQIKNFLPEALQGEDAARTIFQKQKMFEIQAEVTQKGQTLLQNDNAEATREGFAILGMKGPEDLVTADGLRRLADNSAGVSSVWGQKMRDVLTKNQTEGSLVMNKQDWTERMFESTAADALRYGAPELMAWASVADPSGTKAINTMDRQGNSYAQRVASIVKQAEAARYTLLQRYETDAKEAKKEKSALEANDMLDRIVASAGDPGSLSAIRAEFATKKEWLTGDKRAMNTFLMAVEEDGTHPPRSTDAAYLHLSQKELTGALSINDVVAASSQLSRQDFRLWLGKVIEVKRHNEASGKKGSDQIYFDEKQIAANFYHDIEKNVNPSEFGMPIDPEGAKNAKENKEAFTRLMVEFQDKNKRAASFSEQTELMKQVYAIHPPVDKMKLRQQLLGGGAPTGPAAKPPVDVKDFLKRSMEFSAAERAKYIEKFKTELTELQPKGE